MATKECNKTWLITFQSTIQKDSTTVQSPYLKHRYVNYVFISKCIIDTIASNMYIYLNIMAIPKHVIDPFQFEHCITTKK